MRKYSFLKNKYTLLLCILLLLLGADVLLHKGMSRYLLPARLPTQIGPHTITPLKQPLLIAGKDWKKAVNSKAAMEALPANTPGMEMDVYFDSVLNQFFVYHDSTATSTQDLEGLLQIYKRRKLAASLWLDFKNLSAANQQQSLSYLLQLREAFSLHQKIIVESTAPQWLQLFNEHDFFTSYYVPYFNPYLTQGSELKTYVDGMAGVLKQFNVSALSGYYYQLPALKKYFPSYPLLTWSDNDRLSLIAFLFRRKLNNDASLKVVLYN